VHSHGMVDPCDDLKTAAVASGWSSQHVCVCFRHWKRPPIPQRKAWFRLRSPDEQGVYRYVSSPAKLAWCV